MPIGTCRIGAASKPLPDFIHQSSILTVLTPLHRRPPLCRPPPTVFHDLVKGPQASAGWELRYGGALARPFDPAAMYISPRTGRLYHALEERAAAATTKGRGVGGTPRPPRFGLLRSHVALLLMNHIHYDEGEAPVMEWPDKGEFPIRPLPEEEEPVWGLPPMPHE